MIARRASLRDVEDALTTVAPVGEKQLYVSRAMAAVTPYLMPVPAGE
jgi:hypothetical protein